jgi:dTDP-4-dehydrorhamnose reductase
MKIVVLGYGLLGSEIVTQTGWDYLSRKKDEIDVSEFDKWIDKLNDYDVIVNCIANTDTYSNDREPHLNINYHFVKHLVKYCNQTSKKLIQISTDYIYANSENERRETDVPVHHSSWYGYSKLLGDSYVEFECDKFLICRLSHKSKPFPYDKAWDDVMTNADYTPKIVKLVIELIKHNIEGVYNVGTSKKTIYSLALETKEVTPISSPEKTPKNVTMNLDKLSNFLLHL